MFAPESCPLIVDHLAINDFHRSPDAGILGRRAAVVFLFAACRIGGDAGVERAVVTAQYIAEPFCAFL